MLAMVLVLAAGTIAWIVVPDILKSRRRREARQTDNDLLRARLTRTRAWRKVPSALRPVLEDRVRIFLSEREFIGCGGLTVTEPMRITIAAEACLLLLGHEDHVYDELRSILLYPDEFVVADLQEEHGIVTEESRPLSGQSSDTSQVILSWRDVCDAGPGYNVVLHEFAHYHDAMHGLTSAPKGDTWRSVASAAMARLEIAGADGIPCVLDPYSLESEAEFFAVATEAFIEEPEALLEEFPDIYAELQRAYGLSPVEW